jgi:hypothetical protein
MAAMACRRCLAKTMKINEMKKIIIIMSKIMAIIMK